MNADDPVNSPSNAPSDSEIDTEMRRSDTLKAAGVGGAVAVVLLAIGLGIYAWATYTPASAPAASAASTTVTEPSSPALITVQIGASSVWQDSQVLYTCSGDAGSTCAPEAIEGVWTKQLTVPVGTVVRVSGHVDQLLRVRPLAELLGGGRDGADDLRPK
jgi:hypothetical protein